MTEREPMEIDAIGQNVFLAMFLLFMGAVALKLSDVI